MQRLQVSQEQLLPAIEKELVDRLKILENGSLRVMATPESVDEIRNPKTSRILVAFRGESLQKPQTLNPHAPIIQPCELRFVIILQVRDLRTHTGALPLIGKVRDLLTGFAPTITGKPIYQTSTEYVDNQNNLWTFALDFSCPATYVKQPHR